LIQIKSLNDVLPNNREAVRYGIAKRNELINNKNNERWTQICLDNFDEIIQQFERRKDV